MSGAWSLVGRPHADGLRSVIQRATVRLTVVSPFVTASGVDFLMRSCPEARPSLALLTSLSADAVCSGSCDPAALLALAGGWPQARLWSLPALHAKVYVADSTVALITSANLTRSGLFTN